MVTLRQLLQEEDQEEGAAGGGGEGEEGEGSLMSKLPNDIVIDILSRLSVKSLSSCRFVCKSWFSNIQNPNFVATYNANAIHNIDNSLHVIIYPYLQRHTPAFIVCDSQRFPLKLPPPDFHVVDDEKYFSNGLLLVKRCMDMSDICCLYYLCNPITRHHIVLPKSPFYGERSTIRTYFCHDPISKLCMVVNMSVCSVLEIYNIFTGEWKVIDTNHVFIRAFSDSLNGNKNLVPLRSILSDLPTTDCHECRFLNGAIHWLAGRWDFHCLTVVSFKLETDEFYEIQLPSNSNTVPTSEFRYVLFVAKECLSFGVFDRIGNSIEIWVMKDYGLKSSWEKMYAFGNIVMDNGDIIRGPCIPYEFMENGEIILAYSDTFSRSFKYGCYQPATKAFKPCEFEDIEIQCKLHVCSLISPGSITR